MCGTIHTRPMWMVERNFKSLKDFVKKRVHLEGSMVEGYMVDQTMVYVGQYIPKLATNMNAYRIWDVNSINKFEGEYLLEKGKMRKVRGN